MTKQETDKVSIICPPYNATGELHIGHSFQLCIMDIIARYHESQGQQVSWIPGVDHAGIAGQIYLEKQLKLAGVSLHLKSKTELRNLGSTIASKTASNIYSQMKALNLSLTWDKGGIFTLDELPAAAVNESFKDLLQKDLVYKGTRMVLFDPILQTCISDLEVQHKKQDQPLYRISYKISCGQENTEVEVDTTRPETLFADTALAFNSLDKRYRHLIGCQATVPISGHVIPVIPTTEVDADFGTGIMKVSPGHDLKDYTLAKKNNLKIINILDQRAFLSDSVPCRYRGLSIKDAREKIVAELKHKGHLKSISMTQSTLPCSERTSAILEPMITEQWFLRSHKLIPRVLQAFHNEEIKIYPRKYLANVLAWLEQVDDWCISRQIWWGHPIPVLYDNQNMARYAEPSSHPHSSMEQDVLDTWYSSGLWPLALRQWPKSKNYQPHDYLVTGFDILFFWVIRMAMFSYHFFDKPPVKHLFVTGLIRDHQGNKMSKSRGNVINVQKLIDKEQYGLDVIRLTFAQINTPNQNVPFDQKKLLENTRFINKLKNLTRFISIRVNSLQDRDPINSITQNINLWIIKRQQDYKSYLSSRLSRGRTDLALDAIKVFVYKDYCGMFLEIFKATEQHLSKSAKQEMQAVAVFVAKRMFEDLKCFIPDTAKIILKSLGDQHNLCIDNTKDPSQSFTVLISAIEKARIMTKKNSAKTLLVDGLDLEQHSIFVHLRRMCNVKRIVFDSKIIGSSSDKRSSQQLQVGNITLKINDTKQIFTCKQTERIKKLKFILSDKNFLAKAPECVVRRYKAELGMLLSKTEME